MEFNLEYFKDYFSDNKNKSNIVNISLIGFSAYFIIKKIFSSFMKNKRHNQLLEVGKNHRAKRDNKISEFLKKYKDTITKDRINSIIKLDATSLLKEIHSGKISSFEATLSYCLQCTDDAVKNNWITEVLFEEALELAKKADEKIGLKLNLLPLEGLPISIKDCFNIKGHFSTIGLLSFAEAKNEDGSFKFIAKEDSILTSVLKEKGGIIFVKTNTPQNMIAVESSNNLWGKSRNPWNKNKSCGGSSGGEGGIIAGYCSPIGIGTDIGGSIRIPAGYCGIYGFKPSSQRVSRKNSCGINGTTYSPNLSIIASLGPMARSSEDIILITRNLFGSFKEDVYINNSPFNENNFDNFTPEKQMQLNNKNKIKIGFIRKMFYCNIAHEIVEEMDLIKHKLTEKGYECVEFDEDFNELITLAKTVLIHSGTAEAVVESFNGEKEMEYYTKYINSRHIPNFILKFLSWFMGFRKNYRMKGVLSNLIKINKQEYLENVKKLQELKHKFIDNLKRNNINGIICPVMPFYAVDIGKGEQATMYVDFTVLFNVLDMPAVTIPLKLSEKDDYTPYEYDDKKQFLDDMVVKEMPLCIQVATLPNCDEECLKLMQEVDGIYRYDKRFMEKYLEKKELMN
jgi:fatty acid amide hydrolase